MTCCGLMERNASITTLPLTDWIGSTTTATARGLSCSKDYKIFTNFEGKGKGGEVSFRKWEEESLEEIERGGETHLLSVYID